MVQPIPTLERTTTAQPTSTQSVQSAFEGFGEATNNLSAIGARVAQNSSNAMAESLGYAQGKTPKGDLLPPITDFDKTFAESYHAQAFSTLSLQGQKLLDDAHVEISKQPRLTPQFIAQTQAKLKSSLDKISSLAPTAIAPKLQTSFDTSLLQQTTQYNERMVTEQREDQKQTALNAIDLNTRNIQEAATNGDEKTAKTLVEQNKSLAASTSDNKFLSPEQARLVNETSEQALINGQFIKEATSHYNNGTYAEWARSQTKKPDNLSNQQWVAGVQAGQQQVNFLQGLRAQDENLRSARMLNQIALDPNSITPTMFQDFANNVSPQKFEEMQFRWIQALKKSHTDGVTSAALMQDFSNPEAFANASEKTKNDAYNKNVDYTLQQAQKNNQPISREIAEAQVAASAGGVVPAFTKSLQNKLATGNAGYMEQAAQQIRYLEAIDKGGALRGLNDQDRAAYSMYENLRTGLPPDEAAKEAASVAYNPDDKLVRASKEKWVNYKNLHLKNDSQVKAYMKSEFNLDVDKFPNPSTGEVYTTAILSAFETNFQYVNGNSEVAKKMTQRFVKDNFGETGINGKKEMTLHPIEKVLGFEADDGARYIQQDIINQINLPMMKQRLAFDDKKAKEYWETEPLAEVKPRDVALPDDYFTRKKNTPIKVTRHMQTDKGIISETFDLMTQANAFGGYDLSIVTNSGLRSLALEAPYLGIATYTPNGKEIVANYNRDHGFDKNGVMSKISEFAKKHTITKQDVLHGK